MKKPDIVTANLARQELLRTAPVKSVTVVLGNAGFRLEVVALPRHKGIIPREVLGVPVVEAVAL